MFKVIWGIRIRENPGEYSGTFLFLFLPDFLRPNPCSNPLKGGLTWGIKLLKNSMPIFNARIAVRIRSCTGFRLIRQPHMGCKFKPEPYLYLDAADIFGFYYDLDTGEGSENMTIQLTEGSRSVQRNGLQYETRPIETNFEYRNWGSYQVIGFMAERYFCWIY